METDDSNVGRIQDWIESSNAPATFDDTLMVERGSWHHRVGWAVTDRAMNDVDRSSTPQPEPNYKSNPKSI